MRVGIGMGMCESILAVRSTVHGQPAANEVKRMPHITQQKSTIVKRINMAEIIRMPRMSDTMEEGNIVGWEVAVGDTVEAGDVLAEVETDKATMELDSHLDGVLLHIEVQEGPVAIDGIIAVIGQEGEDWQAALAAEKGGATATAPAASVETPTASTPAPVAAAPSAPAPVATTAPGERVKASPLAKNMAKDAGIDLATIAGSGDNGRIVKKDIEAAMSAPAAAPAATVAPAVATPTVAAPATGNFEDKPVSQMRKVIARRLGESKFSAPHFYLSVSIDMTKAMATRKQINAMADTRVSFNDLVIKAAAASLRKHPAINSSWLGDRIRYNKDINIGVAVAVEDGLLVPVINNANGKSLTEINAEVKELAGKAKDRKLQPDEMQGNTFTISNLGMFGIEEFTAIINPPDACIMAVGGINQVPVVKDGELAIGNIMKVTLSCDHRVVDGATGAQFLQTFKAILEDPIKMIV